MDSESFPAPAFGKADLSNCEQEQIHLAGSIQPHGALLVISELENKIIQVSANAKEFLGIECEMLGCALESVPGDLAERIQPLLDDPLHVIPRAIQCHIGEPSAVYNGLVHRPPEGGLVVELERSGVTIDHSKNVAKFLQSIVACGSMQVLCDETARMFEVLTGYDRVMVYRFDEDGHGEVFAEQRKPELEPYLGMRYPASDIPQMARRLYERNRVRLLFDVSYDPVPLTPRLSPLTGHQLDMSLCFLRSMSPIHIQYLKNMGVAGTLVASLVVGGRLWGLVACHHYSARHIPYETRVVCELLAETVATRIAALECFAQSDAELGARRLEQRMIGAISRNGDWRSALFDSPQTLLEPLNATGAALLFDDQVLTSGEVPSTPRLRQISEWLDGQRDRPVIATASLGGEEAALDTLRAVACGIVAIPVSSTPGEYLIWVRPEQIRSVTWGGDPFKPVEVGDDPSTLSPRRSFAKWHQLVEGTCSPWSAADLAAARLIGETVTDVVVQFRSVRMLIVEDQLETIRRQVSVSNQPVVIADAEGRILLTNEVFETLLKNDRRQLMRVDELPTLFSDDAEARQRLDDLVRDKRNWRGEVCLKTEAGQEEPVLVRADPVFSSPKKVLGFVILFTDLRARKAAENARSRFQEGLIASNSLGPAGLDAEWAPSYQSLFSSVVGNAQLAAFEIAEGGDDARTPDFLENVRVSVNRTAELLEHLMSHASSASRDKS